MKKRIKSSCFLRKEFNKLLKLYFLVIVSKNKYLEEMTDMLQAYFECEKSAQAAELSIFLCNKCSS
jgi:hypothetical protein